MDKSVLRHSGGLCTLPTLKFNTFQFSLRHFLDPKKKFFFLFQNFSTLGHRNFSLFSKFLRIFFEIFVFAIRAYGTTRSGTGSYDWCVPLEIQKQTECERRTKRHTWTRERRHKTGGGNRVVSLVTLLHRAALLWKNAVCLTLLGSVVFFTAKGKISRRWDTQCHLMEADRLQGNEF